MAKRPAEVFGFLINNTTAEAQACRKKYNCPFVSQKCNKNSRLIKYPMGVCSVDYNGATIALCPRRFLEGSTVFQDIADDYFGTRDNLIVFHEIPIKPIGNLDFVMVKHKQMSNEIEDFIAIEFQTGQTTSTGGLVKGLKDFVSGEDISKKSYKFGLNMYDIWKRTFTQILNKGIVMETWKKKIYWVVQTEVMKDFTNRYHLKMGYNSTDSSVFYVYDLLVNNQDCKLTFDNKKSSTVDSLFNAFRNNPAIPPLAKFEGILAAKLKANIGFSLKP